MLPRLKNVCKSTETKHFRPARYPAKSPRIKTFSPVLQKMCQFLHTLPYGRRESTAPANKGSPKVGGRSKGVCETKRNGGNAKTYEQSFGPLVHSERVETIQSFPPVGQTFNREMVRMTRPREPRQRRSKILFEARAERASYLARGSEASAFGRATSPLRKNEGKRERKIERSWGTDSEYPERASLFSLFHCSRNRSRESWCECWPCSESGEWERGEKGKANLQFAKRGNERGRFG